MLVQPLRKLKEVSVLGGKKDKWDGGGGGQVEYVKVKYDITWLLTWRHFIILRKKNTPKCINLLPPKSSAAVQVSHSSSFMCQG